MAQLRSFQLYNDNVLDVSSSMKSNTIATTATTSLSSASLISTTTISVASSNDKTTAPRSVAASKAISKKRISWSNLCVGQKVGEGSFATVHKVQSLDKTKSRQQQHWVVKRAKHKSFQRDIVNEAAILQHLEEHEHIVRLEGVGTTKAETPLLVRGDTSPTSSLLSETTTAVPATAAKTTHSQEEQQQEGEPNFLVLERLEDATLHDRLQSLRRQGVRSTPKPQRPLRASLGSVLKKTCARSKKRQQQQQGQYERLRACGVLGLAQALQHVHEHGVAYMDVKPQNVGYSLDEQGTVKLFDFGLSQFVVDKNDGSQEGGLVCAGTPRYCAPEIMRLMWQTPPPKQQQPKHEKTASFSATASDVYSFGVLLWEVATLERPFREVESLPQLEHAVCVHHKRPDVQRVVCPELQALLTQCWDKDPSARPSMEVMSKQLKQILC